MVRVPGAKSDCSRRGEAEVRILDFKTTWSELQMLSQTATPEAKPRYVILNFKTTWSELQMLSETAHLV